MKKTTLFIILLYSVHASVAQPALSSTPVTSGLVLDLRASTGYGGGTWADNSGQTPPNDISIAGNVSYISTFTPGIGPVSTANPSFPAVLFEDNGYGETPLSTGATGLTGDEATIFVVSTSGALGDLYNQYFHPYISLSEASSNNTFEEEFGIMLHSALHHTSNGNYSLKDYPNFYNDCEGDWDQHYTTSSISTFMRRPQVYCAALGSLSSDIDFYVNGLGSTNSVATTGSPLTMSNIDRRITIGNRRDASGGLFQPVPPTHSMHPKLYIFEILVYNRKLAGWEIDQVNEYLKCKYEIFYSRCNTPPAGCTPVGTSCFEVPYFEVQNASNNHADCTYDLMIYGNPVSGKTLVGYEVLVGVPPYTTAQIYPASTPMPISITVPHVTSSHITVRYLAVDPSISSGSTCCSTYELTQNGFCDGGKVIMEKPGATGVKQVAKEYVPDIMIYPNPSGGTINLQTSGKEEYTITITDMMGKQVVKRKVMGGKTEQVSLEGNASGVYMVQVTDQHNKTVKQAKVVVQK